MESRKSVLVTDVCELLTVVVTVSTMSRGSASSLRDPSATPAKGAGLSPAACTGLCLGPPVASTRSRSKPPPTPTAVAACRSRHPACQLPSTPPGAQAAFPLRRQRRPAPAPNHCQGRRLSSTASTASQKTTPAVQASAQLSFIKITDLH